MAAFVWLAAACAGSGQTPNYWTGAAGDGFWTNTANWSLESLPDDSQRVILGNHTASNQTHTIVLTEAAHINQLYMEATEGRHYILQSQNDAALTITNQTATINVESTATGNLTVDLYVYGGVPGSGVRAQLRNFSTTSLLTLGPNAVYNSAENMNNYGAGTIILQGQLNAGYYRPLQGGTLIVDSAVSPAMTGYYYPDGGAALYLAVDGDFGADRWRGSGNITIGPYGENSLDRTMTSFEYDRSGNMTIVPNPVDGSGNLTLRMWRMRTGTGEIITIPGSTVELYRGASWFMHAADNAGISGGGNLRLLNAEGAENSIFEIRRAMTYTGRTMIARGVLQLGSESLTIGGEPVTMYGALPLGTIAEIGASGALNLNGIDLLIGGLSSYEGSYGRVELNGAAMTLNSVTDSAFAGAINGSGALIKHGAAIFTLSAGYTNAASRLLRVEDGLLAVSGALNLEQGTFELAGGRITAETLASQDVLWNITLHEANEGQALVTVTGDADITTASLDLSLAVGYKPDYGREYTLLYAGTIIGAIEGGLLFGLQDGEEFEQNGQEYTIRWENGSEQIILTAIPEPGSLAVMALVAAGLLLRRRR